MQRWLTCPGDRWWNSRLAGRQAQAGRPRRRGRLQLLPPLVQLLTTLGHQRLALAGGELVVAIKPGGKLLEAGRHDEARQRLPQGAGQKTAEPLTAAHQVGAVALDLQLQGLLQGFQPVGGAGGPGLGGWTGLGLS